ncbi:CheR family methyltransferase [Plastorhodobacter daqingensis]|uniref:Chemotaxis protein methyltransferase n=1 Tax=Plastorhodobacter daqingensis TaxID=1387281 RepID=A0ABW2UM75_9RHOB
MLTSAQSYRSRFCDLIRTQTGIKLHSGRKEMIEIRLRRRIQALGATDLDGYLVQLFDKGLLDQELPQAIDLLTTNKTDFFREPAHFEILTDRILPEAIGRAAPSALRFKVWSAASSEGAEAFTAAMVLAEATRRHRFTFAVLGTDISRRMIAKANQAIYSAQQLAPVPQALRDRYTMPGRTAAARGTARIVPELRARVRFRHLNLMDAVYPVDHDVDVIFLRNILIYFGPEDQAAVIARLTAHIAPGGYLIVGHAESMIVNHPALRQISPAVFRKE